MQGDMMPEQAVTGAMLHVAARGLTLLAARDFSVGDVIHRVNMSHVYAVPSYKTIQVGQGKHVDEDTLAALNHSCTPNTAFSPDVRLLIAVADISAGDELTYFYPSTEWDMIRPFTCLCGSSNCIGYVAGARHLPAKTVQRYSFSRFVSAHWDKGGRSEKGDMLLFRGFRRAPTGPRGQSRAQGRDKGS